MYCFSRNSRSAFTRSNCMSAARAVWSRSAHEPSSNRATGRGASMPGRTKASRTRNRLARLLGICEALPEIDISGDQHLGLRIRGKTFAWYLNDHHGDGIIALCCKATLEQQQALVTRDPGRYYVPAYVGPKGWVALRLDLPRVDWDEVAELLFNAYRLLAPRRLAEQLE